MPPPVAVPRDVSAPDLPPMHRRRTRRPVRSISLPHVVGLVRAAIPPMHPGGRPIVAGVAAAAGLLRAVTGRGALPGVLATAATAAFFRAPRRVPPPLDRGRARRGRRHGGHGRARSSPPAELGLPAAACRGSASSCPCSTCTSSACRSRGGSWRGVPAGHVPVRRPGQGQRGQRAQRRADRDRRRRCAWASCRSPGCWPGGSSATSPSATRWRRARPTG